MPPDTETTNPPYSVEATGDDRALIDFLTTRDAPCPVCSYNLRGLVDPVCPECSARLRLTVGSAHLHVGPWALAVVSFALALGFDGVASVLLMIALALSPAPASAWQPYALLVALLLAAGLCAIAILRMVKRRSAWVRLSPAAQWRWAWIAFVGVGLIHAAFGAGPLIWRM